MTTSIRVSDDTKRMLQRLKQDDETFDELLKRLALVKQPIEIGAWSTADADRAHEAVTSSRKSFDQ